MLVFLSIALIVVAVLLLLKRNKPGAIICVVLMVPLAIFQLFLKPSGADLTDRFERKNTEVMTAVLAKKIAERHPQQNITLIGLPAFEAMPEVIKMHKIKEELLLKAFDDLGVEVKTVSMPWPEVRKEQFEPPPDPEGTYKIENSLEQVIELVFYQTINNFKTRQLNRMLRDQRDAADVVICTLPISSRIVAAELLAKEEGPALVLIYTRVDDIEKALQSTVLDMHLTMRPDASWELDYKWPKDAEEAFNYRYALATREKPSP